MNSLTISGIIWSKPQLSNLNSFKVVKFTLDYTEPTKNNSLRHNFFECEMFGEKAEEAAKLEQGQTVLISGEIRFSSWEDKKSGEKRKKVNIKANHILPLQESTVKELDNAQTDEDEDIPF